MSAGRAPSPPSSTFAARGAALHGQHPRFSFSMISPSNFVEERAPRLSAMGGRAGCNPDNPLELTTKCRLLAARGSKNAQFLAPPLHCCDQLISLSFSWITSKACCVTLPPETSPTSVLAMSYLLRLHCM